MTQALQNWFDEDKALKIPGLISSPKHPGGKQYTVASPSYETGLLLQRLGSIAQRLSNGIEVPAEEAKLLKFDDDEEQEFAKIVLGSTFDEMHDDEVTWGPIKRTLSYVFTYYAISPDAAERLIAPKAPEPTNRAAKRAKPKKK